MKDFINKTTYFRLKDHQDITVTDIKNKFYIYLIFSVILIIISIFLCKANITTRNKHILHIIKQFQSCSHYFFFALYVGLTFIYGKDDLLSYIELYVTPDYSEIILYAIMAVLGFIFNYYMKCFFHNLTKFIPEEKIHYQIFGFISGKLIAFFILFFVFKKYLYDHNRLNTIKYQHMDVGAE